MTDIAEQAARKVFEHQIPLASDKPRDFDDPKFLYERNKAFDTAQALADAGLLREPERVVPTQDDITDALGPILFNNFNYPKLGESTAPLLNKITDAVLALLADQPTVNEVKAQAWAECAQWHAEQGMPVNGAATEHNPYR